jgi:crossover junction endodeoxyribonuclease RuvC
MIILGIDPGSINCGYGVIDYTNKKYRLIEYGVIKAKKISEDFPERLKAIHLKINEVIIRNNPDVAVFETIFYAKNIQSTIKLSHARSVAILSASLSNVAIDEYSPMEVKKSVTGRGNASKEQVQFMVKKMLSIEETPELFDATDALAVAICHCNNIGISSKKSKSWSDFIKDNPGKVIGK